MRVLRVLTRANAGGPTRQALDLWRCDPAVGQQTLVSVGSRGRGEAAMDLSGLPEIPPEHVDVTSRGVVCLRRLGRDPSPWRHAFAVRELRQLIRRFRPDVVHTHTSQAGWFGRVAALAERVPVLAHTFHGHVLRDYYPAPLSALLRRVEAGLARRTTCLFAVSPSCRAELEQLGVGENRIVVVPPALDLQRFDAASRPAARRALGLGDGVLALGFAGRLVPIKRPEVFAELLRRHPEARGLVFGSGPSGTRLPRLPNLELCGHRPDLGSVLPALDALVVCSKREGMPLVVLEAAAAGVPVVGFDVPGVRDAVALCGGVSVPEAQGVAGLSRALRELDARRAGLLSRHELVDHVAPLRVAELLASAYRSQLAPDSAEVPDRVPDVSPAGDPRRAARWS
ncbi:MAG: glycosyltransferase [Planctomycetes bacterium]|nr:glycosyltransferase [Planctomycetota bacterium]MCB9871371.1 glycosyltransferase [Planctomycetota bacterium]MCB9888625.1 glycosyltransferase [Planctomycetota bacterium]